MLIAIGDTQGKNLWKQVPFNPSQDTFVFIGDYFDTSRVSVEDQIVNFREIIDFKRNNKTAVVLLIGTHDYHYMPITEEIYMRYQRDYSEEISQLIWDTYKEGLFQIAFRKYGWLFTHAGVSNEWLLRISTDFPVDIAINHLFESSPKDFSFQSCIGKNGSKTGDDTSQSPLWIRPESLAISAFETNQVVGHTRHRCIEIKDFSTHKIVFIDCLNKASQYVTVENGVAEVMTIGES